MLMMVIWLMNEMKRDACEYGKWLMKEEKREVETVRNGREESPGSGLRRGYVMKIE